MDGFLLCPLCCFFFCQRREFVFVPVFVSFCLEGHAFVSEGFCFCLFSCLFEKVYQEDFVFLFVVPFIFPLFSHFVCFPFVCLLFCLFFLCFPILSGFSQQHLSPSLTGRFNRTSWVTGPQGLGGLGVV